MGHCVLSHTVACGHAALCGQAGARHQMERLELPLQLAWPAAAAKVNESGSETSSWTATIRLFFSFFHNSFKMKWVKTICKMHFACVFLCLCCKTPKSFCWNIHLSEPSLCSMTIQLLGLFRTCCVFPAFLKEQQRTSHSLKLKLPVTKQLDMLFSVY